MRRIATWLGIVVLCFLGTAEVRAEEPTPKQPAEPPAPVKPADEKPTDEKPVEPKPADPAPADDAPQDDEAEEPAPPMEPRKGYAEVSQSVRGKPRREWRTLRREAAIAWLEKWADSGQKAAPADLLYLGRLHQTAEQYGPAADHFAMLVASSQPELARGQGAAGLASLIASKKIRDVLGARVAALVKDLTAFLGATDSTATAVTRGSIHRTLGGYFAGQKDEAASVRHYMKSAVLDPAQAYRAASPVFRAMMASTHAMDGYAPLQKGARAVHAAFRAIAEQHLATTKERLAELEKDAQEGPRFAARVRAATSAVARAKSSASRIDNYARPFPLLGTPAKAWTLEHAFGDLKQLDELKGKVVVLDFWATWCPWCIRSFPAIRDVLKDYAGKDLAFVGVTASAGVVYDARYALDDDLKDRVEPGAPELAAARRVRPGKEPEPEKRRFDAETYERMEKESIAKFIKNHEMTWPVVMIDAKEPSPKYALAGWPHAVVIDKQGRIRFFKSGALLRSRPDDIQKFRALLDALLAE